MTPTTLEEPMAKKKTKPKPDPMGAKPMVLQMRGSVEWKEWLEELAAEEQDTVAKFVERVLKQYALSKGRRSPPNR